MRKKGQAALEFLTTYGWAFLVILVMIGALAYFGVLDPTRFLPQRCQFGAELHCERYSLNDRTDIAAFELRNSLPNDITIDAVQYKIPENDSNGWTDCNAFSDITIKRENLGTVNCSGMSEWAMDAGEKQRVQFKLIYSEGSTYDANFANDIFGEVYANIRG